MRKSFMFHFFDCGAMLGGAIYFKRLDYESGYRLKKSVESFTDFSMNYLFKKKTVLCHMFCCIEHLTYFSQIP